MDIATVSTAYSGLKYAKEVLTALLNAKVEAATLLRINEVVQKMGDAQDALFSLREELARYQDENETLKSELRARDEWKERTKRYFLVQAHGGAVVYRSNFQPEHFACPICFEKRTVSILQDRRVVAGIFDCLACKAEYHVREMR